LKERPLSEPVLSSDLPSCEPIGPQAKRELVSEIVQCLAAKTHNAEMILGTEQRANRAMRVTLEVLQRQNACLQQQISWVAQGWPHANVCWQSAENTAIGPTGVVGDVSGGVPASREALAGAIEKPF